VYVSLGPTWDTSVPALEESIRQKCASAFHVFSEQLLQQAKKVERLSEAGLINSVTVLSKLPMIMMIRW
jgi:hypothetical protein